MKKQTKIMSKCLLVLLFIAICVSFAFAESYPERPIKMIVPFDAGGGTDTMCRTLAPYLSEALGVEVVIENRGGAGTQIGLSALLNAKPDGYTFGEASQPHASFSIAMQDAPYEIDDFAWMNFNHIDPVCVNVMNDKPWDDLKELFDYIKENPGEVAMGVTQMSGNHMTAVYLRNKFDLDFIIVPYSGGGPGRAALVGGHIDVFWANALSNYSLRDQSKCLAVGWDSRSELWPEAPTFDELFNDPELNEFVKPMASFRAIVFPEEFKENFPERWEIFYNAYKEAYNSPGYRETCDKTGQTSVLSWTGPEEAEKLAKQTDIVISTYSDLLE